MSSNTHVLVKVNHRLVKTNVLYPTFELATIGGIEWRASDDLADAEKCRGIKLPQISFYLLVENGQFFHSLGATTIQFFLPDENGVGPTVFHLCDLEHGGARVEHGNGVSCEHGTCDTFDLSRLLIH